jgi:hypothetical protein
LLGILIFSNLKTKTPPASVGSTSERLTKNISRYVMARPKSKVFEPILFPILQPYEYMALAKAHKINREQAKQLSGFSRNTWSLWLGHCMSRCPDSPQRDKLEKLHRIAETMGWIKDEVIAA